MARMERELAEDLSDGPLPLIDRKADREVWRERQKDLKEDLRRYQKELEHKSERGYSNGIQKDEEGYFRWRRGAAWYKERMPDMAIIGSVGLMSMAEREHLGVTGLHEISRMRLRGLRSSTTKTQQLRDRR